jgi:hypothetical protein
MAFKDYCGVLLLHTAYTISDFGRDLYSGIAKINLNH